MVFYICVGINDKTEEEKNLIRSKENEFLSLTN